MADAKDMSSQVFSLAGVPGRSIEMILGRRDVCLPIIGGAIAGEAGSVSVFGSGGACTARTWFGRVDDEPGVCETAVAGVGGLENSEPLATPAVSAESCSFFVALLTAVISSLLGRNFLSMGLKGVEVEGSLDFDAVLASGTLEDAPPCFGLGFTLDSAIGCIVGSVVLVICSLCCKSFAMVVALEDEVGSTGTTGLIAALTVDLR